MSGIKFNFKARPIWKRDGWSILDHNFTETNEPLIIVFGIDRLAPSYDKRKAIGSISFPLFFRRLQ